MLILPKVAFVTEVLLGVLKVSYSENMRTMKAATLTSCWRMAVCPLLCLGRLVKTRDWL